MAFDMFLKIDGIQGESTDNRHRDEIDILSYAWGESQPAVAGSGAGAAAGRVTMQDFHFTMRGQGFAKAISGLCEWSAHQKRRSYRTSFRRQPG